MSEHFLKAGRPGAYRIKAFGCLIPDDQGGWLTFKTLHAVEAHIEYLERKRKGIGL